MHLSKNTGDARFRKKHKYNNINVDHEPLERPRKAIAAFPILRVLVNWKFHQVKYLEQRAIGIFKKQPGLQNPD